MHPVISLGHQAEKSRFSGAFLVVVLLPVVICLCCSIFGALAVSVNERAAAGWGRFAMYAVLLDLDPFLRDNKRDER